MIYGNIQVHPSEIVECYGKDKAGRNHSIYFSGKEFKAIAYFLQFTDHLGHAYWHYRNPEYKPGKTCNMCKKSKKEQK